MTQPVHSSQDVLGETLGSLLGELAWSEVDASPGRGSARGAPSWRPAAVNAPAASSATPDAEATSPAQAATRPWSMALDALAGRLVRRAERSEPSERGEREDAAAAALASRVEARQPSPASAPWSYVLQRLAGKDLRLPGAAPGNGANHTNDGTPAQWKTVATRSPGETVGELLGAVDWT